MNLDQLLSRLAEHHVQLWAEAGHLRVRAKEGAVDPTLRLALMTHKPRLLELLQRPESPAGADVPHLEVPPREGPPPLSFAQERLWRAEQREPQRGPAHMAAFAMRLEGPLDLDVLARAVAALVERHEVLRTSLAARGDTCVQRIAPPGPSRLSLLDLSHLTGESQQLALQRHLHSERRRRVDLEHGTLFRAVLLRLAARSHVLLMLMHHAVVDGTSRSLLIHDLSSLYAAFVEGRTSPLRPLRLQYGDFARWQRQQLQGEGLSRQLAYWRQQLEHAPEDLSLPGAQPRPEHPTYRASAVEVLVEAELVARLREVGHRAGATLFMVLLTTYYVLLARVGRQRDLLIGTPAAHRGHPDFAPLIGTFVNTLALRLRPENNPSFMDLLEQARRVALDAYAHPDVALEDLGLRAPQAMLVFKGATPRPTLAALRGAPLPLEPDTTLHDLTLALEEQPDGPLRGELIHDRDILDASLVRGWARTFEFLLQSFASAPEQRVFPPMEPVPPRSA
ncbi:hypothetical protein JGU66_26900 [Myxococcaceae bacterium JPH2]|nr:hypothetical protein [Myxococcaceae bacterium JPH2]